MSASRSRCCRGLDPDWPCRLLVLPAWPCPTPALPEPESFTLKGGCPRLGDSRPARRSCRSSSLDPGRQRLGGPRRTTGGAPSCGRDCSAGAAVTSVCGPWPIWLKVWAMSCAARRTEVRLADSASKLRQCRPGPAPACPCCRRWLRNPGCQRRISWDAAFKPPGPHRQAAKDPSSGP